ncbi:MAG: transcription antitermination protein NusB [Collinsella sp.]
MASLKVNRGRTLARSQALQILFQSEMRKVSVEDVLAGDYTLSKGPLAPYAIEIARGVSANRDRIDSALRAVSANWTLERMPGADRNLLRAAVYELVLPGRRHARRSRRHQRGRRDRQGLWHR